MKIFWSFCLVLLFSFSLLQAQYTTPGDNMSLTFEDLVQLSAGVVVDDGDAFLINNDINIAATDTLKIAEATVVKVEAGKQITVMGTFIADPADGRVVFTAQDTVYVGDQFKGFRFEDAAPSVFRNTTVKYSGGIQLLASDVVFEYGIFRNNGHSNVSAVINYSGCSPVIRHSVFKENSRAAIGSGANVQGSPKIFYNEFLHNVTENSNRPQLNLGPGAANDTIMIVGNYIEGMYEQSGGIAIGNIMSVGLTLAVVSDNVIVGNRYGYTQTGNQINTIIRNNELLDNNIQNIPSLGGSGLNFFGNSNNISVVRGNIIAGNLWGITTQNNAHPDLGTEDDHGSNVFYDNENGGQIYAFYNNTANPVMAIGNYWGTNDAEEAEQFIFHQNDDPDLGPVTYEPVMLLHPEITSFTFPAHLNDGLDHDIAGDIDEQNHTISVVMPFDASLEQLVPHISVPKGADILPESGQEQDFTDPVIYGVSVPHGDEQDWVVVVETEQASTFTLSFVITDAEGSDITDALITLNDETYEAGVYVFDELPPGVYSYEVAATGYLFVSGDVEIIDENIELTIELMTDDVHTALIAEPNMAVYPNPVSDYLIIDNPAGGKAMLRLYTVSGELIMEQMISGYTYRIDMNHISEGAYILQIGGIKKPKVVKLTVAR